MNAQEINKLVNIGNVVQNMSRRAEGLADQAVLDKLAGDIDAIVVVMQNANN